MRTRKRKISPRERQELRKLTLMDDSFMNLVLKDNIPCAEEILRVILKKDDLVVKKVQTFRVSCVHCALMFTPKTARVSAII